MLKKTCEAEKVGTKLLQSKKIKNKIIIIIQIIFSRLVGESE